MDFGIDIDRNRVWVPKEGETVLALRGYRRQHHRWIEGEYLVCLIESPVSSSTDLERTCGIDTVLSTPTVEPWSWGLSWQL
jgi:hypothetical protein